MNGERDFGALNTAIFSFPIAFQSSELTELTEGEIKSMNSSSIVYPYLSTQIGKPFLVSIFLFCSLPIKSWCHKFFELSWATTITVLKPVSCDHVTSFNYDDKKVRDVGLTCWCHLSNIMTDSIFHESMRQGITCSVSFCLFVFYILFVCCLLFFFFFAGWYFCFPQDGRNGISCITITSEGVGKS